MSLSYLRPTLTALAFVLVCACGGAPKPVAKGPAAPSPEPEAAVPADLSPNVLRDRRAEPGVRAPAKPLVIGKAGAAKCGKLPRPASDAEMSELLGGRLLVRPPSGAKVPAALPEAPAIEEESRVIVESPSKKEGSDVSLAIVARETFQLDPDLYEPEADAKAKPGSLDVEAPKFLKATFPSEEPLDVVPVELGTGPTKLRAYAARPPHPNAPPGKDTALVLALLLAQEDGTLESVGFYVRGETVRNATGSDLVGCTRLAERIAATIAPGPRKLERAAGKRKIADVPPETELAVTVPADYVSVPFGTGARLYKLRPLSLYAGSISVSVSDATEKKVPEGADATVAGKLLGRPMEWRGKTSPKGGFFFAAETLDPKENRKTAEVLVRATRQAKVLDEMRAVAETLSVVKRGP
ncbi:MAG: hypothetical protein BGO98_26800 [Myxococcales bacterium 68-20]|nr:MAG: hypothetical protein BGO98_26800 [Myxococcales bacterium 68-20]